MKTIDFDYDLPNDLIALHPSKERSKSRLLIDKEPLEHKIFLDLHKLIEKDDLLVLNNTSVIPARLFGKKETVEKLKSFLKELSMKLLL